MEVDNLSLQRSLIGSGVERALRHRPDDSAVSDHTKENFTKTGIFERVLDTPQISSAACRVSWVAVNPRRG
jgi:hypothetical protein